MDPDQLCTEEEILAAEAEGALIGDTVARTLDVLREQYLFLLDDSELAALAAEITDQLCDD